MFKCYRKIPIMRWIDCWLTIFGINPFTSVTTMKTEFYDVRGSTKILVAKRY